MTESGSGRRTAARAMAVVCTFAVLCPAVAAAQGKEYGIRGGVNIAKVDNEHEGRTTSLDSRIGIVAGAFVTWPVLSWLQIQPEALYTSKGGKVDEPGIDSTLVLDYLELPLLARFTRRAGAATRFYAAAGPAFAVRLRARTRTVFSGSTEEMDISDEVERTDLGVVFGGGIERGRLVIDARYTFGLADIDAGADDGDSAGNRVLSVTAGWRF